MDFSKMKEQMGGKIKEELTQKVDEVKADIEKKFSNSGGMSGQKPNQSANPVEGQKLDESGIESSSQANSGLKPENVDDANQETEDTKDTKVVAQSDSTQADDESQDEKEVA